MNNFAILAFSRTGSSSLSNSLRIHPDIKILGEPFHAREDNKKKFWYITLVNDLESFVSTLDMIYARNNGIKHLLEQVPMEYNEYIYKSGKYKIIYLYRKNILKSVVSEFISRQTKEWGTMKEKVLTHKFDPIPLNKISIRLSKKKNLFLEYRHRLQSQRINYYDLSYEELYGEDVDIEKRMGIYFDILDFLGFHSDINAFEVNNVSKILNPYTKLNSFETYKRIPNIEDIEKEFGSPDNGYLFE